MGMSDAHGPADEAESIATIHRALGLGINPLDTSDAYGIRRHAFRIAVQWHRHSSFDRPGWIFPAI